MKFSRYLKKINILYVEDDKIINKTTSEVLTRLDYQITSFEDPSLALEYYLSNFKDIDLLISDIHMPKIDGIELVKKVKEKNKKLPIILYTAFTEEKYLLEAISLGVNEYLKKPIDFKDLRHAINQAVYPSYLEKRNLEQNILINQQSKDLLIAKTVSMISHQWKQPLARVSSIVSKLSVLLELDELDKTYLKENLNKIEKESKYLASVISKFEEVLKKRKPEYFKVSKLLIDSIELLTPKQKKLVDISINSNEDFFIYSNFNEFKTVILNLLVNCVNNIENKKIKNGNIKINTLIEEENLVIEIIDNALGMDNNKMQKAFDLYYSDENLNKKGLGLYFVRLSLSLLVEGKIEIKNIEQNGEKGLSVKVEIPLKYIKTTQSYKDYQI